jgi:hypothetical protein
METMKELPAPTNLSSHLPWRAATQTPSGTETSQVRINPTEVRTKVFLALLRSSGPTGAL